MAITASQIGTSNTLEQFRVEFNNLQTDLSGLESGTLSYTALSATTISVSELTVTSALSASSFIFEGATDNDFETTLAVVDPTADRTVSLPDLSGVIALADTAQTLTNKTLTTPIITGAQLKNGATSAGFAEFFEDSDNGTNKVTLIGPASTADVTLTLPAETGTVLSTGTTANTFITGQTSISSSDVASGADELLLSDASASTFKRVTVDNIFSSVGGLTSLAGDTSPQLGGDLDTNSSNILIDDAHFIADENGNEQIIFQTTSSAVNQFDITNAATGSAPLLSATGGDTNIDLNVTAKGTGHVTVLGGSSSGAIQFNCESNSHGQQIKAQPHSAGVTNLMLLPAGADSTLVSLVSADTLTNKTLTAPKIADGGFIADANGNELVVFQTTGSAVNELEITNNASGSNPIIAATGGDTNIGIALTPKGTGEIVIAAGNLNYAGTAITSTGAEINALDGITAVVGELNALDLGSTAVGTAIASKAVILDSNKDYTGIRNFTISGEIDAATGDFSGAVDVAGTTTAVAITASGLVTANADMLIGGTTPTLTIGDAGAEDTKIVFDGNAQDFYIALDDSADDLLIGLGSTVGTTPAIAIDENLLVTTHGGITMVGTTPTLTIGDAGAEDTKIVFDGNAQDFYIGLDDSADDLLIGLGSAVGTTPAIAIDENLQITTGGDIVMGGTTPTLTIGDAGAEDAKIVFDGNAQDFHIGLDDSADDLVIGLGSALGTTPAISIDENLVSTFGGAARGKTNTANATGSTTLDFNANQNHVLTATGNVTLANPSTEAVGQSGIIVFIQDGTGSRTLSTGTDYETPAGAALTISTAANAIDIIPYFVSAAGSIKLGAAQIAFG
jgi:hypothetical protein